MFTDVGHTHYTKATATINNKDTSKDNRSACPYRAFRMVSILDYDLTWTNRVMKHKNARAYCTIPMNINPTVMRSMDQNLVVSR